MNIFNKVSFQGLKKNRTRTLVTIIGVVLSAALITAVATFAVSLQSYMVNGAIEKYGKWHVEFPNTNTSFVKEQMNNDKVSKVTTFENVGYATLEGAKNPDKPYLFLAGFHEDTYDTLLINLLSGRLPENSNEIIMPVHVAVNGGVTFSVGDTITLNVGTRQSGNETLGQHDSYHSGEETLTSTAEKTYTVVGTYQRPSFEERSAPGYTLITAADTVDTAGSESTFITLKKPTEVRSYVRDVSGKKSYVLNDAVLRFLGISDDTMFNTLLYSIGGVLVVLIMVGSVFLIYNSFNISLNERIHQFGILMSVGATEKQLRNSVLFEGICIGVIGIPLGILIGIPSVKVVLSLAAKNFSNVLYHNVPLTLKISVPAIIAAAVISMITILISAYIPARKAAQIPIMECIRQTNEIKVEAKAIKTSKLTRRLYGLEGMLALKNFKRNKRRYRSIILSLSLSVVLFVSTSAFTEDLKQISEQAKVVTDYDIGCSTEKMNDSDMINLYNKLKSVYGVMKSSYQTDIEATCAVRADQLSDDYWKSVKDNSSDETVYLPVTIQFLDDDTYQQVVKNLDLSADKKTNLIAIAKVQDNSNQAENVIQFRDMFISSDVNTTLIPKENGEMNIDKGQNICITNVEIAPPDTPPYIGAKENKPYFFQIVAPWSMKKKIAPSDVYTDVRVKGLTFKSDNPAQSTEKMQAIIEESGITSGYTLYNVHAMMEQNRNILFIVKLFTTVFIVMISLIAVANVFNTISTNIKLRRRELAMLRSVGMSDRDFNKMMRFECALYGLRTMIFGLPISGILSWLIYKGMVDGGASIDFKFPWSSIGISIIGVIFVIFVSMLYSTSKIKKENIIDALRDDMA